MNKVFIFLLLILGVGGLYLEQQPEPVSGIPWAVPVIDYTLFTFIIAETVLSIRNSKNRKKYLKTHIPSLVFVGCYSFFFVFNKLNLLFSADSSSSVNFFFITARNILLILKMYGRIRKLSGYLNSIAKKPAQTVVLSFFVVIMAGALVLMLPVMSKVESISFIDAVFTSCSAVCVTGLTVVDTAMSYSVWGKAAIMVLMQIGGLGIMLLSTFMILVLRRSVSLKDRSVLSFMLDETDITSIMSSVKRIITLTFTIEAAGAALLFPVFLNSGLTVAKALFYAAFHSVSAFCNAGFALFSDSLVSFQGNLPVNLIIAFLIILGGISFAVIIDTASGLARMLQGRKAKFSINTTVVLKVSGLLILLSTMFFYRLEHESNLYGMSIGQQYLASFFQAVTLRTAGFNSVPFDNLGNATLLFMIAVMFIGGASGSTAGGIKVNTLGVVWAYIGSFRKERDEILIYRHVVPREKVLQAFTVIAFGVVSIMIASFIMMLTENAAPMDILFETVSAFATVGLSTGITPGLSLAGKVCIICLMFIGRLGPLTLLTASSGRERRSRVTYPDASLLIG